MIADDDVEIIESAPRAVSDSFFYPVIKPPFVQTSKLIDESLARFTNGPTESTDLIDVEMASIAHSMTQVFRVPDGSQSHAFVHINQRLNNEVLMQYEAEIARQSSALLQLLKQSATLK